MKGEKNTATTSQGWSELLRRTRVASEISQRKMADLMGMPQARISKIEKGDAYIRIDTMQIWLKHCGYEIAIMNDQEVIRLKA